MGKQDIIRLDVAMEDAFGIVEELEAPATTETK